MRKLREAALVVTMVGSVSMLGAGAASAHGDSDAESTPHTVIINCTQETGDNTASRQVGLINIQGPLLGGGNADSKVNQQVCGLHNDHVKADSGDSEGGDGGTVGSIVDTVTG